MGLTDDKFTVGIARCEGYGDDETREALRLAISRAGGLPDIPCDEVLIKANLLAPSAPEEAVTTHPSILSALAGEMRGMDKSVHIADNPGYIFTNKEHLFGVTGIKSLSRAGGISFGLLSDLGVRPVKSDSFRAIPEARMAVRYLDAPYVINAAKLKTHVETETTGCIKNIFGAADTATRKKCHQSRSLLHLANAITDLFSIRPPDFNVMDAVVGMEGDGPSHGSPRKIGWILSGRNALAVDWAASLIMGYRDPLKIPLINAAASRGMGPRAQSEIILEGAVWSDLPSYGFKKSSGALRLVPTFLRGLAHNLVSLAPGLERGGCVRCGVCKQVCPVDAISDGADSYPAIKRNICVKCLCCHEMCPTGAMAVRKNILASIAGRFRGD
ncbi:MAG: DUF362 domain-containing protein [Synergistaceae bacterium]|jgi:uncharacterized protein (DUF362 family)/Pyruvate/2-oxoacid:ferredoxin oxidoreductase delta subunit|nr:DUF362 domain-containing protein [Synergistaceae bacterium]